MVLHHCRKITRQDLQNYISTHYSAPRMVLAAAGGVCVWVCAFVRVCVWWGGLILSAPLLSPPLLAGVDHNELVKLAEKHFSSLPSSPSTLPALTPCRYTGCEMRVRDDDMPFAHIVMAVEVRTLE